MTEHRHAEVLRAIADGQEVEYWSIEAEEWVTGGYINPITSYELKWRVKPKPPIVDVIRLHYDSFVRIDYDDPANVRLTFDPETKQLIKVELI
jgi:hypothetical protein